MPSSNNEKPTDSRESISMEREIAFIDPKLAQSVLRRLDCVVLPIVGMLYLLSIIDRSNIGNARVAGLQRDLGLSDWEYQTAITVTYVPYICAEIPSNLLIAKVGPRVLLPALCTAWGIVTTLQSRVNNFSGLVACRVFLGLCEGGIFPGIMIYLSGFYRRHELQLRVCFFFCFAAIAGALSGLLAAGIVNLDGVGDIEGWRWIFLLEGLFTVAFGILTFFIMPDRPSQVLTFQTKHVRCCEIRLLADKVGSAEESKKFNKHGFLSVFTSVHIWILVLCQFTLGVCFFGLAYFPPTIVATLVMSFETKASEIQIQLLSVPPYVAAFAVALVAAYLSDRYKARGLTAAACQVFSITGFSVFLATPSTRGAIRYFSLHLIVVGVFGSAPSLLAWVPNNAAPYTRRTTAIAAAFIGTNLGGILSTWIYPSSSAPAYRVGGIVNLVANLLSWAATLWAATLFAVFWYRYLNKRSVEKREQILENVAHLSVQGQYEELGDKHPDFVYTV